MSLSIQMRRLKVIVSDDAGIIARGLEIFADTQELIAERDAYVEQFGAVGDGVADDGPAIKRAAATGKNVVLTRGKTYLMNTSTVICAHDRQRFYGGGRLLKTTRQYDADYLTIVGAPGAQDSPKFFHINGVDGVEIDNIEMEYTGATPSPRVYGITTQDSTGVKVTNCGFFGQVTPVFFWRGTEQYTFTGNKCYGGIFHVATGGDSAGNTDGLVLHGTISNNTLTGCAGDSIDLNWDTQHVKISGNYLFGNGIDSSEEDIDIGGGDCSDILVADNIIDGREHQRCGVWIKLGTKRVSVRGNTILGDSTATDACGVFVDGGANAELVNDITVSDNEIRGWYHGVRFFRGVHGARADGNTIYANAYGVRVDGSPFSGNPDNSEITVSGNDIASDSASRMVQVGIAMTIANGFTVEGNRVSQCVSDGIQVSATATHGSVVGNEITLCDDGIVNLAARTMISGNRTYGNDRHGISTSGASVSVIGNHSWDNSTLGAGSDGFLFGTGSDFAIINGNRAWDTRGTKLMDGIRFVSAQDRCILIGNQLRDTLTPATGLGGLTNSQQVGNIVS